MPTLPAHPWRHSLLRLGLLLSACGVLGLVLDAPWPLLAIGLAIALAHTGWQLHRLQRLLAGRRRVAAPENGGVFADLEARLQQRQADARRRKRRLRTVLRAFRQAAAALPDGIVVVGADGLDIEWFNPAAGELLGLRHPQDLDLRITDLLRSPRVLDWFDGGAREPLFDLPAPHDPARRLGLRLIDYTARQKLLIVRDITKLMRLEQVRRDFVGNVSHELRTPLTVIHGYLELMDADEMPQWAAPLAEMRRQSARMTQLVEDLLTLSRIEAGDRVGSDPVPMRPLLSSLAREAESLSAGRHRIAVEDDGVLDLLGSERDLHSAFSNLVANAVRYTPAGGSVSIRFQRTDAGACFSVVDTGPGIPAEHVPRLTERFYRVSTSRSRSSGGTGLGLAIVKHVLQVHGARLEVSSTLGHGSTFTCVFGADRVMPRQEAGAG